MTRSLYIQSNTSFVVKIVSVKLKGPVLFNVKMFCPFSSFLPSLSPFFLPFFSNHSPTALQLWHRLHATHGDVITRVIKEGGWSKMLYQPSHQLLGEGNHGSVACQKGRDNSRNSQLQYHSTNDTTNAIDFLTNCKAKNRNL